MENGNEGGRLSYFAYLISKNVRSPASLHFAIGNAVKTVFAAATPAGAAALTDVFKYVRLIVRGQMVAEQRVQASERLRPEGSRSALHPRDAEKIVRYAFDEQWPDPELIHRYVNKMLKLDPKSPLFSTSSICTAKARIFFSVLPRKRIWKG